MVHSHATHAIPGKQQAFGTPVPTLIIEIGFAPVAARQPTFPIAKMVAAYALASEGGNVPQVSAGPPAGLLRLPLGDEFARQLRVATFVQRIQHVRQLRYVDFRLQALVQRLRRFAAACGMSCGHTDGSAGQDENNNRTDHIIYFRNKS